MKSNIPSVAFIISNLLVSGYSNCYAQALSPTRSFSFELPPPVVSGASSPTVSDIMVKTYLTTLNCVFLQQREQFSPKFENSVVYYRWYLFSSDGDLIYQSSWVPNNGPSISKIHKDGITIKYSNPNKYERFKIAGKQVTLVATQNDTPWDSFVELTSPFYGEFRRVDPVKSWGLIGNFYIRPDTKPADIWESETWPPNQEQEVTIETPLGIEVQSGKSVKIVFFGKEGKIYRIQKSPDLHTWTSLLEIIEGDDSTITRTVEADGQSLFFRVTSE